MLEDEQRIEEEPGRRGLAGHVTTARDRGERALTWGREKVPGVDAVVHALETERLGGGSLLAGGLAYRLFFWFLPMGLVAAALLSFWVDADPEGVVDAAEALGMGAAAAQSAAEAIAEGSHSTWYFLVAGVALVVYFSRGVVRALYLAHALAWRIQFERIRPPIWSGALFTGVVLGLGVVAGVAAWLREESALIGLAGTLAMVVVFAGVALWTMTLLPHGDAATRALVPGAVLVALGMQAIHLFVVLYLTPKLGRSSALYGSLGVATVILLWLYATARLIVASAFLNATVWRRRHDPQHARRPRSRGAQS